MKFSLASVALAAFAIIPCIVRALDPITIKGTKFFYSNGTEFYIVGVAYQPAIGNGTNEDSTGGFVDPLADPAGCSRDIPLLTALGVNVIRTYAIDTSKDHSQCIQAFANAGVYIISDLSAPGESTSIDRSSPQWTVEIYQRYTSVVDLFAQYPNVLGFFAGNEVTNNASNTPASAFVKAAIRDTKAYIASKNYRQIPVGYSANDDSTTRESIAEYFACAPSDASADFYGINMYEWCGDSTYQTSGYEARTEQFANYSIPIFFSEYGCNVIQPRIFTEVQAIYSAPMTDVWSGGIVYEWFEETNNYGLVTQVGSSVSILPDYTALSKQLQSISPTRVQSSAYTPSNSPPPCPGPTEGVWEAATSLPPTPNQALCDCVLPSLGCAAVSNLPATNVSSLFGYICGSLVNCEGITANGTAPGEYGAFSPCDPNIKLSWIMNKYYDAQNKAPGACNFGGAATTQGARNPTGTCVQLLNEAGTQGTGTVTSTNGAGNPSGSKSAASGHVGTFGDFRIISAVVAAVLGGVVLVVV